MNTIELTNDQMLSLRHILDARYAVAYQLLLETSYTEERERLTQEVVSINELLAVLSDASTAE